MKEQLKIYMHFIHVYYNYINNQMWLNIISECACDDVSKRDEHLYWWPEYRKWPSPMSVGFIQPMEGPNRTKR